MKKSYLLLGLVVSLLVLAMMACSSDDELTNTSWKFLGFYSHETDSIEIAQPEGEQCYVINFHEDGKFSGRTATNEFEGRYTISDDQIYIHDCFTTKVGEMYDGERFYSSLHEATRYSISNRQLRLYYNNNQDYLLFNVR
jgi:heat shock protein HslJ